MEPACLARPKPDFAFGLDNVNFSNRTLAIEIIDHSETSGLDDCNNEEASDCNEASACSPTLVKTIRINSIILAEKSPFFYKLFSNGMRESKQYHVTLRIEASEEAPFMDLMNYMYTNNLLRTSMFDLVDVLVTADKFEVGSCVRDCIQLLQNLPMTCESALLFLDFPTSLLISSTIQPLIDISKQFLLENFKDVDRFKDGMLNFPLAATKPACLPGVRSPKYYSDFTFGLDNDNFSDRILNIEIIGHSETGSDNCSNRKRRHCDDQEAALGNEVSAGSDYLPVRVKIIHINSIILAEKSRVFYKLLSNDMRESKQQHVTLRIEVSEEASFMDLLNYIYSNNLPKTSLFALVNVLVIGEKFEVGSCVGYCIELLQNLPMTFESALLYLGFRSSVLIFSTIQPLIDAAKQFLAENLKKIDRFIKDEVLNLPIETVLCSDGLKKQPSESVVNNLALTWTRKYHPDLEETQMILKTPLLDLIRFSLMRKVELKQSPTETDDELASTIVLESLYLKASARTSKFPPVKVIEFKSPHQQCIVYLDLKQGKMKQIFPDGCMVSRCFRFGGHGLALCAKCIWDGETNVHFFELLVLDKKVEEGSAAACIANYEVSLRMKPSKEFVSVQIGSLTDINGRKNLFRVPWTHFVAGDSPCFINGNLHLRVELTI